MAQDIENIVDLLNRMQKSNAASADSFDRLLTSIITKLDMKDNNSGNNLMQAYMKELKASVEDKYSSTLSKFENIEKAIKAVYDTQGESVKNSDMKELFDIFSKNVNNFYTEARQEKAILAGIETKIGDLANNKTDKEDILRTISLLRNDLGNLNLSYKNTIDEINTSIKSVLAGIRNVDPLKSGEVAKTQIDAIYKSINDVITSLESISDKEENLEKILGNVATNEDLKITQGILDSIIEKTKEIDEKLNSNVQKDDLTEFRQIIEGIDKKTTENTEGNYTQIRKQTEDILSCTDGIKQTLGKVAKDIEHLPDATDLERCITELYKQIDSLTHNIGAANSRDDLYEMVSKMTAFEEELGIIKNIIEDLNEALTSKVLTNLDTISESGNEIEKIVSDMFKNVPQKSDIENLLKNNSVLNEISQKTDDISSQLESLPEIKDNVADIALKIPNVDVSKEISNIYSKTTSIENWLVASNIKENSEKIATQIEHTSTSDEVAQIQYTTNEIITVLDKLSKAYDVDQVSRNIDQIGKQLNSIMVAIDKSDTGESAIYEKLSDLQLAISQIVSRDQFDTFIEDLKSCILNLTTNTGSCSENVEHMQHIQKEIEAKLSELDFSKTKDAIEGKFEQLHDKIETLKDNIISIKEFIANNSNADYGYIKSELENIKSLMEENSSDFKNAESLKNPELDSVKEYLSEVKNILQDKSQSDLYSKILRIEDSIVNNQTYNENAFSQIIEKIGGIKFEKPDDHSAQFEQSISEIVSLKTQIEKLTQEFEHKSEEIAENPEEIYFSKIENFIGEKLAEIANEIKEITKVSEDRISDGFAYHTELLEQKTSQLQKFICDIDSNNKIDNPKFSEKLSDANVNLEDFKQELQLVSTDMTENISHQTSNILEELEPIRVILDKMYDNLDPETLRKEIRDLNSAILATPELEDYSKDFEDLYDRLSEKFIENENNLKDFILTDTDSIIIKLDNLRDYVEKSLNSMVPPDAENMAEFQTFVKELKDFKESQNQLLGQSITEIKKEIKQQSEEIKSMISVAKNHEEIINAIEDLKNSFKSKSKKIKTKDEEEPASYNVVYDKDSLEDLKLDFEKYSKKIEELSDANSQISNVLQSINQQLENISLQHSQIELQSGNEIEDEEFEVSEDDIFGNDRFDFVQAFDILQNDIKNLSEKIEEIKKSSENKQTSKIPSINNSGMTMNINSKVDEILKLINKNWLSDIEKFIKSSNIGIDSKLDSIEAKLDVFVSDTTNTDILNEVSETLGDINDSVADIAPKIEEVVVPKIDAITPKIDEIVPKIAALTPAIEEKLSESDKKLSLMIEELNEKITQISDDNGSIEELNNIKALIGEQKNYIEDLEPNEKLQAFKKCLEEISFEINALAADSNADNEKLDKTIKEMKESLMGAVVTIFDQVSFVEETEDIKDFVQERTKEINKNIAQITKQLHQMTSSDDSSDYKYSMQDIETDLAKLRLALQDSRQVDLTEITNKLHSITSSVDMLTQDEMKELKTEISNLKEQTEFLIANSDRSYNALNTGIEGFGEIINGSVSSKVDKLSKMLESSAQSDTVIKQALIYIGEWIDSATSSINNISENSSEIGRISEVLNSIEILKSSVTNHINDIIEEKFTFCSEQIKSLEKQFTKVENLEIQLVNQQERIDRLEMNIDKLLSIVENLEEPGITRKIDKIEKQLSKLGSNVEKLASYVD